MTIYLQLLGETTVTLWGLSSRERITRMLARLDTLQFVQTVETVPAQDSILLLRGDYLFDERILRGLLGADSVLLRLTPEQGSATVAAHVPATLAIPARNALQGGEIPPGTAVKTPAGLASAYNKTLLKSDPPSVLPITSENRGNLEQRLFYGAYKGITDLVTKWLWPRPAQQAVRFCVRHGIRPNHVTGLSLVLAVLAGLLFWHGYFGWGLLTGWVMTFLDTVDGKLARVTITSTPFGNIFDHGIDLVHPPLWYIAWGLGLASYAPGLTWLPLDLALWWIVVGYIVGRLVEGLFEWSTGFSIFSWRPFDSYFRLITARRNPNLLLLTAAAFAGRPDLGLAAVALWTVATTVVLLLRLVTAFYQRINDGPLQSWLRELDHYRGTLAARWFSVTNAAATTKPH